ncbi:MAG TPA: hypothetical protein ENK16_08215 [Chromatiales bacterium]|nr:hypothetical protein [Chromatiales bacterium]
MAEAASADPRPEWLAGGASSNVGRHNKRYRNRFVPVYCGSDFSRDERQPQPLYADNFLVAK